MKKTASVTRLPCQTYRADIPASLRAMADQIERGEMSTPDSMVTVCSGADGVEVFGQGIRADDDIFTIGLLDMGKGLIVGMHSSSTTDE